MLQKEGQVRIPAGCAISGIFHKDGARENGTRIIDSIRTMHDRSNGLGGGFAGYGIYPEYADYYAFHVFFDTQAAKDECEREIEKHFDIVNLSKIPTRQHPRITDEPMIWRGPLVAQALTQLLTQTNWHDLDYLVIDMPPGTGDIQLTLSQTVPVTGAIVVTTPQDIALLDAKKGLRMFQKVNVPILGVVENMSIFVCPECGHAEHIFGEGGAKRLSETYHVDVLGQLPLDAKIREEADSGAPTVVSSPESMAGKIYREIALKAAAAIAKTAKDMSLKMPSVRVENN